jgi:hypothetical protein
MQINTDYLSESIKQTLGEDVSYAEEVAHHKPRIFFRPDDRTSPDFPTYAHANEQGISYIGFITVYGSHAEKRPPVYSEPRVPIRIVQRVAKKIQNITSEECSQAYKELTTSESVRDWLQKKYSYMTITLDSLITVHRIEYV